MAQEISEKRNRLLGEMKSHLQAGQNDAALKVARELCGILETVSEIQEAA